MQGDDGSASVPTIVARGQPGKDGDCKRRRQSKQVPVTAFLYITYGVLLAPSVEDDGSVVRMQERRSTRRDPDRELRGY